MNVKAFLLKVERTINYELRIIFKKGKNLSQDSTEMYQNGCTEKEGGMRRRK
jgi:hypothetical protein